MQCMDGLLVREMRAGGAGADKMKGTWGVRIEMKDKVVPQETDNLALD